MPDALPPFEQESEPSVTQSLSYRDAGVDIDAGDQLVGQKAVVLLLGSMQPLQHRRTLAVRRELAEPVINVRASLVAQHHHRVDVARRLEIS